MNNDDYKKAKEKMEADLKEEEERQRKEQRDAKRQSYLRVLKSVKHQGYWWPGED